LQRQDRQPLLNDALLFLQALSQGCHLLTRNIVNMDYLQQCQPGGQVLFYRQKACRSLHCHPGMDRVTFRDSVLPKCFG
jgi:hypothetical protein